MPFINSIYASTADDPAPHAALRGRSRQHAEKNSQCAPLCRTKSAIDNKPKYDDVMMTYLNGKRPKPKQTISRGVDTKDARLTLRQTVAAGKFPYLGSFGYFPTPLLLVVPCTPGTDVPHFLKFPGS